MSALCADCAAFSTHVQELEDALKRVTIERNYWRRQAEEADERVEKAEAVVRLMSKGRTGV